MTRRIILNCVLLIVIYLGPNRGNEYSCHSEEHCGICIEKEIAKDAAGKTFCCTNCNGIPIIQGDNCTCFNDELGGRIIFPGSASPKRKMDENRDSYKIPPVYDQVQSIEPTNIKEVEALVDMPTILHSFGISTSQDNSGIKQSLDLLIEAMQQFDQRLRTIESRLELGYDVRFPAGVNGMNNLLNPVNNFLHINAECRGKYRRMGNICIFVSSWADQRANWKDAYDICKGKGGQLIEILDHEIFHGLSKYLSSSSATAGLSFWIGALNPGGIWLWMTSRQGASLNSVYWKRSKYENGLFPKPGDTSKGSCLRFHYDSVYQSYHFQGIECNKDSFFICQMI